MICIAAFMLCWFGLIIPRYANGYVAQNNSLTALEVLARGLEAGEVGAPAY
jgi:hypothetical protein